MEHTYWVLSIEFVLIFCVFFTFGLASTTLKQFRTIVFRFPKKKSLVRIKMLFEIPPFCRDKILSFEYAFYVYFSMELCKIVWSYELPSK
jgi:hypothetical protein